MLYMFTSSSSSGSRLTPQGRPSVACHIHSENQRVERTLGSGARHLSGHMRPARSPPTPEKPPFIHRAILRLCIKVGATSREESREQGREQRTHHALGRKRDTNLDDPLCYLASSPLHSAPPPLHLLLRARRELLLHRRLLPLRSPCAPPPRLIGSRRSHGGWRWSVSSDERTR